MIPYGRQEIIQEDIDAVSDVLRSDFLTQGPAVPAFEKEIAHYCAARHAVACNSATSALHLACLALGIKEGDYVWTSPITFVATANVIKMCGAEVGFIDIQPNTFNIDPVLLKAKLSKAQHDNCLPKAIIVVHMAGQSCDMGAIASLAKEFKLKVIEDASHAIGGSYKGSKVGSCRYSDITVFSFHPVKIITSGEGGVATTNQLALAEQMEQLRSHGVTRAQHKLLNTSDGPWYYEQQALGFNYRMTDIHAALGVNQLKRLDGYIKKRNTLAAKYNEELKHLPILTPVISPDIVSAFHLYIIRLEQPNSEEHLKLFRALKERDIGVNLHYIPVYRQPYYQYLKACYSDFPNAEAYYQSAITIPLYPSMTESEQMHVISSLRELLL